MRAAGSAGRIAGWNDDRSSTFPTEAVAREARAADVVIVGNVKENKDPFCTLDPEVGTGRTNGPGVALAQENCGRMEERNDSMYKSKCHTKGAVHGYSTVCISCQRDPQDRQIRSGRTGKRKSLEQA
jgi:hypothetical protein